MSAQDQPQGEPQGEPQADAPAPPAPKRQLTEEQLRNLARGRKLAIEARKAKAIVRHAGKLKEKMAVAEAFNQEVEEAKATVEQARPKKDPPPPAHVPAAATQEPESPPRPKKESKEPSPKDRYYLLKLQRLEAEMMQDQPAHAAQQYAAAPPRVHAYDVARGTLKARADRAIYENVYRDMFGGM